MVRRAGLGRLARAVIVIEPYLGETAHGPSYGREAREKCRLVRASRQVVNEAGTQILSTATLYIRRDAACPARSRITLPGGRVTTAITSTPRDSGGLSGLDHLEVACD